MCVYCEEGELSSHRGHQLKLRECSGPLQRTKRREGDLGIRRRALDEAHLSGVPRKWQTCLISEGESNDIKSRYVKREIDLHRLWEANDDWDVRDSRTASNEKRGFAVELVSYLYL